MNIKFNYDMIYHGSMFHGTYEGDRKGSWAFCFGFWYFLKLEILNLISKYIKQDVLGTLIVLYTYF